MKKMIIFCAILLAGIPFHSCAQAINGRSDSVNQMTSVSSEPTAPASRAEISVPVVKAPENPAPASLKEDTQKRVAETQLEPVEKGTVKTETLEQPKPEETPSVGVKKTEFDTLPPPDAAKIGQCMGKVTILGEYKEIEESILVTPATTKTISVPAEYRDVEEEIILKEAATKIVKIPTTYKTVEETVVVTPEIKKTIIIPAKYTTVKEKVMVHPERKVWKATDKDGKIMKLVMEPAEYKDVTRQVLVENERTEIQTIPAVTKKVKKQIVDQPERTESQIIPAVKKKIKKQVLVSDAAIKTIEIPATYRTEKRKIIVRPDREEWHRVLCDENATSDIVKRLQGALIAKGYDLRIADGIYGAATKKAVAAYQKSLGFECLAISFKTLASLGIK